MANVLRWPYCDIRCADCPLSELTNPDAVRQEVAIIFQEYGTHIDEHTTVDEAIAMAVEASTSSPEAIGQAVVRQATGQCPTSPETSLL